MSQNSHNSLLLEEILDGFKEKFSSSLSKDQVFELFTIQQITKDSDLSDAEIEDSVVDGGQDGGIDSFLILINDQAVSTLEDLEDIKITGSTKIKIMISQMKNLRSFQERALDRLHISIPLIFDRGVDEQELLRRFNPKLVEKILILRRGLSRSYGKQAELKIIFTYACTANEISANQAFRSKAEQIIQATRDKTFIDEIEFEYYSARELIELYRKFRDRPLTLRFKEGPIGIEFQSPEYGEGYLGVVRLKDYRDFVVDEQGKIRETIFESNVRHYQGEVDVNKEIRKTLDKDFSVDFWWLNNGVTIIASTCKPSPKALTLTNVQIVNGLQTSYIIGSYYPDEGIDQDQRSLLVKVVIIPEDKVKIDKIISASNKQNAINPTVLRATDEIQRNLEQFFLSKSYFYDRRKNYYKNQNKPSNKIFSIQYAAQAIEAILNFDPASARSKPTTLIKEDTSYDKIFDKGRSLDAYLKCCLLYQKVADFIKTELPRDERSIAKNFSYHVARVVASLLTSKANYDVKDIEDLDILALQVETVQQGYILLKEILREYQNKNPEQNIINVAKARKFSEEITQELSARLLATLT